MTLIDQFVEFFNEVMSNRLVALVVMIGAAIGGIVTIAGGYYATYRVITYLSN